MATLATQQVSRTGLAPTFTAAAGGGDSFHPGPSSFLVVKNGGGSPVTVTIVTPGLVDGLAIADQVVSVPNAGERWIGPLSPERFRDNSDGLGDITYSAVTTVTVGVVSV